MASRIEQLPAPVITDEGACLLRNYSLSPIAVAEDQVVFLRYSLNRKHKVIGEKEDEGEDESADENEVADGSGEEYFRVPLGELRPGGTDILKNFVEEKDHIIRVIQFNIKHSKRAAQVDEFVEAITEAMDRRTLNVPPILESPNLSQRGHFITGTSLRSAFEPKKFLTLFVSIPYLTLGTQSDNGGVSLSRYRSLSPGSDVGSLSFGTHSDMATETHISINSLRRGSDVGSANSKDTEEILVHQAWFLIFDNRTMAVFKSVDDTSAPLFPYQQRLGGFQALVQMISNTITSSETIPVRKFLDAVSEQEMRLQDNIKDSDGTIPAVEKDIAEIERRAEIEIKAGNPPSSETKDEIDQIRAAAADGTRIGPLIKQFNKSITEISTIMSIAQTQIKILGELRDILQNPFEEGVGRLRPFRNAVKLPFILGEREQIRITLETIDILIEERKAFRKELSFWLKDLRCSQTLSFQDSHMPSAKEAQEMKEAIAQQGQTISVFTLITSVFLPLGFLASYFAMYPPSMSVQASTQTQFWIITAPITLATIVLMSVFLYRPDDWIKEQLENHASWALKFIRLFTRRKKQDPLHISNTPSHV